MQRFEAGGKIIRERRNELGLTRSGLAKSAGISSPYLCDIEKGSRSPHLSVLLSLARHLSIDRTPLLEAFGRTEQDGRNSVRELVALVHDLSDEEIGKICTLVADWRVENAH